MSRSFLIIASVFCTAQLASAADRYVTLSEEKLRLSEKGALKYSTLSEGEKAQLFRKYERQCGRMVSGRLLTDVVHATQPFQLRNASWQTWRAFITFHLQYSSSSERSNKYETFKKTLVEIDLRNSQERLNNGTAVFGVTVMSDLSDEEFKSIYLASKMPEDDSSRRLTQIAPPAPHTTETDYADWRGIYTTPIKYQDSCGSCW